MNVGYLKRCIESQHSLKELDAGLEFLLDHLVGYGVFDVLPLAQDLLHEFHGLLGAFLVLSLHHGHLCSASSLSVTDVLGQVHRLQVQQFAENRNS